jgi:hypothetical protein
MYGWVPYVKLLFPAITVIGMIVVAIGAFVTSRAVLMMDVQAIEAAGQAPTAFGYAGPEGPQMPTKEQYLQQPGVRNLIRQSRHASCGLVLIGIGTLLQIAGTVPSFFGH